MSKISTVYDYYISELGTLFSSKTKIPNPYSLQDNSTNFLRDSWGLKMGGQSFFRAELCFLSDQHNFIITLCREVVRQDHDDASFDTAAKALKEDLFTLREYFYDKDNMNSNIDKIDLGSSDPVGFFVAGKTNFIFSETIIPTVVREQFT